MRSVILISILLLLSACDNSRVHGGPTAEEAIVSHPRLPIKWPLKVVGLDWENYMHFANSSHATYSDKSINLHLKMNICELIDGKDVAGHRNMFLVVWKDRHEKNAQYNIIESKQEGGSYFIHYQDKINGFNRYDVLIPIGRVYYTMSYGYNEFSGELNVEQKKKALNELMKLIQSTESAVNPTKQFNGGATLARGPADLGRYVA